MGTLIVRPKPSPLFDEFNTNVVYSLRKIRSGYTGSAIRVRRSSDNAQSDIGFINNVLDTTALLGFVGAGDGYVVTWYDQVDNKDASASGVSNEPLIVISGSVNLSDNGKPALLFDGVDDFLFSGATLVESASGNSMYYVGETHETNAVDRRAFSNTLNSRVLAGSRGQSPLASRFGSTFDAEAGVSVSRAYCGLHTASTTVTSATQTVNSYINGSFVHTYSTTVLGISGSALSIGGISESHWLGNIQELAYFVGVWNEPTKMSNLINRYYRNY